MKSEKSGNIEKNQSKSETRGRKPLKNKSVQVSWRIKHDTYQLLEKEQARIEKETGVEVELSKVFQGIVNKYLI